MSDTPHLHITFFSEATENKAKSLEAGRPIFEDREFVRIKFAGDKYRELVAPASECEIRHPDTNLPWSYKDRFPKHYAAFKDGQDFQGDGTPLSELPFLTESKRAELRAVAIHTAEALAGLDGALLTRLGMGGRALKDQATAWLSKAQGAALETKLAGQNAELREQMKLMQEQIAELTGKKPNVPEAGPKAMAEATDAELKDFIKETTGEPVRGNPSRATLEAKVKAILQPEEVAA